VSVACTTVLPKALWHGRLQFERCRPRIGDVGDNELCQPGQQTNGLCEVLGLGLVEVEDDGDIDPRTAGAGHRSPLRFDLAWHLDAWCISNSMGLNLRFFCAPYPLGRGVDIPDDRLAALGDVDVLNGHLLLALRAIFLQGRHLRGERSGELVEGVLGAVLLRDIVTTRRITANLLGGVGRFGADSVRF